MKRILIISFLIILLCYNHGVAVTPDIKEFTSGNRSKFSTKGHPKAKGVNMVISYPNTWFAKEGDHPNIVQKIVSEGGKGTTMVLISTRSLPFPVGTVIPEKDLKEFLSPEVLKEGIPPGGIFINAKSTKIDGTPAGILEYSAQQERAGIVVNAQFITYIFLYKTILVQLQCGVTAGKNTTPAALSNEMENFKTLFMLMANSIILPDIWK